MAFSKSSQVDRPHEPQLLPGGTHAIGLVPPVNIVSLLQRPNYAEVVLPPYVFLAYADGADPEGRRPPQRNGFRIADSGYLLIA